jgi:hypothetical protein
MVISDYIEFNNKNLFLLLKEYIKVNPCCSVFPNCDHPRYQSGPNVFNIIDKNIDIIKNRYFESLLKIFNKKSLDVIQNKAWVYLTLKNEKTKSIWHSHEEEENTLNISGLLYVTETSIGTEFKTKFIKYETIPHVNRWYLWESSITHRPKDMVSNEDRLVIATSTVLKK